MNNTSYINNDETVLERIERFDPNIEDGSFLMNFSTFRKVF